MKTEGQKQAEERINILDRRCGEGIGAKRERARLAQKIGLLMCGHYYHPIHHPYLATGCLVREFDELDERIQDEAEYRNMSEPDGY